MILYLDTSALVKKYIVESGSDSVRATIDTAELVGLSTIVRAETVAAFAKAVRMGNLTYEKGLDVVQRFRHEWSSMLHIQITEQVVAHADSLAWKYNLRGYDAVHLASAELWQTALGEPVTMAVFDRKLWAAAVQVGLRPFPTDLDTFFEQDRN